MDTMVADLVDMVESTHTIGCSYVCQGAVAAALSEWLLSDFGVLPGGGEAGGFGELLM